MTAPPRDPPGLLEHAVGYALDTVRAVEPEWLPGPTPCAGWDLRRLLCHLDDSLAVLGEAATSSGIRFHQAAASPGSDPAALVIGRARRLMEVWRRADRPVISVDGQRLTVGMAAGVGAIEIAVHGWDVATACGQARPIPTPLATALLAICPLVVTGATRRGLFAAPVPVPVGAAPGDRLVAYLGRDPRR